MRVFFSFVIVCAIIPLYPADSTTKSSLDPDQALYRAFQRIKNFKTDGRTPRSNIPKTSEKLTRGTVGVQPALFVDAKALGEESIRNPTDENLVYLPFYFESLSAKERNKIFPEALKSCLAPSMQNKNNSAFIAVTQLGLLHAVPNAIEKMAEVLFQDKNQCARALNNLFIMLSPSDAGTALVAADASSKEIVTLKVLSALWDENYSSAQRILTDNQTAIPFFMSTMGHLIEKTPSQEIDKFISINYSEQWQKIARSFFSSIFTGSATIPLKSRIAVELSKKYESSKSNEWSNISRWLRCVVTYYVTKELSRTKALQLVKDLCALEVKKLSAERKQYAEEMMSRIFEYAYKAQEGTAKKSLYLECMSAGWEAPLRHDLKVQENKRYLDIQEALHNADHHRGSLSVMCCLQIGNYYFDTDRSTEACDWYMRAAKKGCQRGADVALYITFYEQLRRGTCTDEANSALVRLAEKNINDPDVYVLQAGKRALAYKETNEPLILNNMLFLLKEARRLGVQQSDTIWHRYATPLIKGSLWREATLEYTQAAGDDIDFDLNAYAAFLNDDKPVSEKIKMLEPGAYKHAWSSLLCAQYMMQLQGCTLETLGKLSWEERKNIHCMMRYAVMQGQKLVAEVSNYDVATHNEAVSLLSQGMASGDMCSAITLASIQPLVGAAASMIGTVPFGVTHNMLVFDVSMDTYIQFARELEALARIETEAKNGESVPRGACFRLYFAKAYDYAVNRATMTPKEIVFVEQIMRYGISYLKLGQETESKEDYCLPVVKTCLITAIDSMIQKNLENKKTFIDLRGVIEKI